VYDPRTFYGIGSPGAAVGPDYGITNRTYQRFGEYAALFESKSNNKFGAPQYCPRPSGTPGIVFTDGADPTASVTVENKDADGNDVEMTYEGGFFTIADNSTFSGTAGLTAFALLDFARDEFAASDYVADQFDAADNAMQARCKRIDLGDVCVGSLSSCEDELPAGCDKTYNDTVKSSLNGYADKTDSHGNQFRITASTSEPDDCVKVGHSSSRRESGRFSVGWKDEDTAGNCAKINAEGCGCADYCTGNEDSCGSCKGNGITAGTFDGKCPTGSPWVDKKITCPAECCAMEWSCTESQADSGAWRHEITLGCRANACEQKCCEQTAALAENVVCTYEYFGTASASVEVSDAAHSYPLGNGMTNLKIPFYAVSGNVPASEANCAAATWDAAGQKMDYNAWGAKESSLCCPASVSDDSECKTGKT
jgi:hypothetical protein